MKILPYRNYLLLVFGFLATVIGILFFTQITNFALHLLERFSPDNSLTIETKLLFRNAFSFFLMLVFLLSIFSIPAVYQKIINLLMHHVDLKKLHDFFVDDAILEGRRFNLFVAILGFIASSILVLIFLFSGVAKQEGAFETSASFLSFFAALMLIYSAVRLRLPDDEKNRKLKIRFILLGIAGVVLLFFGEEISWGQHFFRWDSPKAFDGNYQGETNLHNFFNPIFRYIYYIPGVGIFLFLFMVWVFPKNETTYTHLVLPHRSLFFIVLFFPITTYSVLHETFEQIFGLFAFLYSLRLILCADKLAKEAKYRKSAEPMKQDRVFN